jgi:hypothetical protein
MTVQVPALESITAVEPDRRPRMQVIRLHVTRILRFSQANALLRRLFGLPGARRITLERVANGELVVDICAPPPAGLERTVQYLWADHPGTTLHRLNSRDDVTEIEVRLGRPLGS